MLIVVLLMIALMNSAISILMADIEGNISGFLLSTSLIVIFAEILPQALVNRHPIVIGYYSRYVMWLFFGMFFLISYPISAILEKLLGEEEGNVMSKNRMKKLFEYYEKQ